MQRENTRPISPVSVVSFLILVIPDGIGSVRFDLSPKKTFSNPWFGNMIDGSGEARNENCIVCRFKIIVRIIDSMIDILVDTIIA